MAAKKKSARKANKGLFTELAIAKNTLSKLASGYGFDIVPNPDLLLKDKGYRFSAWSSLLSDTHFSGALDARKSAILGMNFRVDIEGTKDETANEIISKFIEENATMLIPAILDCLLWGFQPIEIIWDIKLINGKQYTIPLYCKQLPCEYFAFNNSDELVLRTLGNVASDKVDERKIVCARYNNSNLNPYGESLLTRCYWPINWKRVVWKFWVDFLERFGFPNVTVKYDNAKEDSEVKDVVDTIASSLQDSVMAISKDYDIASENKASSGTVEVFDKFIKSCDDEISKAVLGHTGSMRSEPGKLGNENVATDSKADKKLSDRKIVEGTINKIIRLFYEENCIEEEIPATFVLYDEKNAGKDRADLDRVLYDMNVRYSDKYIQDTYQLPQGEFWTLDKEPTPLEQVAASSEIKGTVGGIQVISGLVEKYEQGLISREASIAIARIAFGYLTEEAEELFPLKKPIGFSSFASQDEATVSEKIMQSLGEKLVLQIMEEIGKSSSFEDALDRITEIYPKLETAEFIATLEKLYMINLVRGELENEG